MYKRQVQVRLFAFKTVSVSQAGDDAFSIFAYFFTQAGNVDVNGTVQHLSLIHICARNLHAAARRMAEAGGFPVTYTGVRALKGVGAIHISRLHWCCGSSGQLRP